MTAKQILELPPHTILYDKYTNVVFTVKELSPSIVLLMATCKEDDVINFCSRFKVKE